MADTYAIIEDGTVSNMALAESPLDENWVLATAGVAIGWLYDGEQFSPPPMPEPTLDLRITKLAFRNRFTQSEKVAIELAAADDPSAPMQQRQMSAAVRAYLADVQAATFIDLARQDLRDGVHALEANGLISSGRAESILSNEITSEERYYP